MMRLAAMHVARGGFGYTLWCRAPIWQPCIPFACLSRVPPEKEVFHHGCISHHIRGYRHPYCRGIAISVHLHYTSIKGQRLSGSQQFYVAPRMFATDLADVDPIYYSRKILVTLTVVLIALSVKAIGTVINVIVR